MVKPRIRCPYCKKSRVTYQEAFRHFKVFAKVKNLSEWGCFAECQKCGSRGPFARNRKEAKAAWQRLTQTEDPS